MSLESCYGYRVIRDVVRRFFIAQGFRPRRVRGGHRIPRAKYLFSFYNEEGMMVGVFYDREQDTIVECSHVKQSSTLNIGVWSRDKLLSLLLVNEARSD